MDTNEFQARLQRPWSTCLSRRNHIKETSRPAFEKVEIHFQLLADILFSVLRENIEFLISDELFDTDDNYAFYNFKIECPVYQLSWDSDIGFAEDHLLFKTTKFSYEGMDSIKSHFNISVLPSFTPPSTIPL